MRAYPFDDFESLDHLRLHNEPDAAPQRGELLIRVHTVSLNHRDMAMVNGRYPRAFKKGLIPTSDRARGKRDAFCHAAHAGPTARSMSD